MSLLGRGGKIHLYEFENVLKPRGSMKKESLSAYIFDKLVSAYESWTDPEYADSRSQTEVMVQLTFNLMKEVEVAAERFCDYLFSELNLGDSLEDEEKEQIEASLGLKVPDN